MNRAERRRKAKDIQKKMDGMKPGEIDDMLHQSVGVALKKGHAEGVEFALDITKKALQEEFGFGPKRLERLDKRISDMVEDMLEETE